jgi:hypothetical protein
MKTLIKRKLEVQPWLNVYHLDTKKRGDYSSRDGILYTTEQAPPVFRDGGNKMVWQPVEDNAERYSKFFLNILNAGIPAIVNIDEAVNMVFGNTSNIPRGLKILLSQGRLPGIHVYGGTQELANAPRQMISQSTHLFGFNVENDYDERMLMSYLRIPKEKGRHLELKRQEFYYRNRDLGGDATLYHDAKDFVSRFL